MNATTAPIPMLKCIARVFVNPSIHGEKINRIPSRRLSQSSRAANATNVTRETTATRAPLAHRSIRAPSLAKANSHGVTNKNIRPSHKIEPTGAR